MSKVATSTTSKSKKVSTPVSVPTETVVSVPTPTETVVSVPTPAETVSASETVSFKERVDSLIKSHLSTIDSLKQQVQELRKLQKEHDLQIKEASKKKKKGPRDFTKTRTPTGFAGPVLVSSELYSFLTKTKATMKDPSFVPKSQEEADSWPRLPVKAGVPVARTDVTSHINQYIKTNNLQNPENRREIVPDAALKKLFSEPTELSDKTDQNSRKIYTYLGLQRYMSAHFPNKKTVSA